MSHSTRKYIVLMDLYVVGILRSFNEINFDYKFDEESKLRILCLNFK